MKKIALFIILCITITTAVNAQNESATASQTAKLALSNAIEITFNSTGTNNGGIVDLAFNSVNDFANGVESQPVQLKIRSNKKFIVKTKTNAANFTYNGTTSPTPTMPVLNVLYMKVTNNQTGGTVPNAVNNKYRTMRKNNRRLITNGTPGDDNTFDIQYKATPGFAYPAGTYTVDVIYTATQK